MQEVIGLPLVLYLIMAVTAGCLVVLAISLLKWVWRQISRCFGKTAEPDLEMGPIATEAAIRSPPKAAQLATPGSNRRNEEIAMSSQQRLSLTKQSAQPYVSVELTPPPQLLGSRTLLYPSMPPSYPQEQFYN